MNEQHNSLIYIFFENMGGTLVHKDKICSWMKTGIQNKQLNTSPPTSTFQTTLCDMKVTVSICSIKQLKTSPKSKRPQSQNVPILVKCPHWKSKRPQQESKRPNLSSFIFYFN